MKKKTLVFGLLIFGLLNFIGCTFNAKGSYVVTGTARPAISPTEVRIYSLDAPPSQYVTIGVVEASAFVGSSRQASQDKVTEELKKNAAKIGANGIILTNMQYNPPRYGSSGDIQGKGTAIYVAP